MIHRAIVIFLFCAARASAENFQTQFEADIALLYSGPLRRPGPEAHPTTNLFGEKSRGDRTLGLRKAQFGLALSKADLGGAGFAFRPDYEMLTEDSQQRTARELEVRSGSPYRKQPTVKLLDLYHLRLDPLEGMKLRIGVFDDFARTTKAFSPLLGFGGKVEFPRKTQALELSWLNAADLPTYKSPSADPTFGAALVLLQGRDDRGDQRSSSTETNDEGRVSQDPHWHVLGKAFYRPETPLTLFSLVGYGVDAGTAVAGATSLPAKINDVYLQLGLDYDWEIFNFFVTSSFEARFEHETYQVEGYAPPKTHQQSLEYTQSVRIAEDVKWLLAYRHGLSERHNSALTRSLLWEFQQYELGFEHAVRRDLVLSATVTQEYQQNRLDSGERQGSFVNREGQSQRSLRRIAFGINYALRGSP